MLSDTLNPEAGAPEAKKIVVHVDRKLRDLVPLFLANRRTDAGRILRETVDEHFEAIHLLGHRMKASGAGYGFAFITEVGRDVEEAAGKRDGDRLREIMGHLTRYLDRVEVVVDDAPGAKAPRTRPIILCVDDDPDTQHLLTRLVTRAGYEPVIAGDGAAALTLLKTLRPDLILLDVKMPGLDGQAVCARLQQDKTVSYIPVIFVTALGDEKNKAQAFGAGAVDYMVKPIQGPALKDMIAKHLKTRQEWNALRETAEAADLDSQTGPDFARFKEWMLGQYKLGAEHQQSVYQAVSHQVYATFASVGIDSGATAQKMAGFLDIPYRRRVSPEDLRLGVLPAPFCRSNKVVPVIGPPDQHAFIVSNPFDVQLLDLLRRFRPYSLSVTTPENIAVLFGDAAGLFAPAPVPPPPEPVEAHPKPSGNTPPPEGFPPPAPAESPAQTGRDIFSLLETEDLTAALRPEVREDDVRETSSGIVRLVNKIIIDAHKMGASDIHIEPYPDSDMEVRFRIDGDCQEYLLDGMRIPRRFARAVASRLKIMCNLDIAERRLPQDGKIRFRDFGPLDIELRVATVPTAGSQEDVVIRILAASGPVPLDQIGMSAHNLDRFREILQAPYGLILCVGPTGSGKTTTLHSALSSINTPDMKIWTAEDPVEITQRRLRQVQVHAKIGFTFARAMRAFLRCDPDVIMVGEMRDLETTEAGIEASLTGHLVFSTLHTNSAPESVTRLLDMGIDPFTFGDSLLGVLAQRLCRRLCPECRETYRPDAAEWGALVAAYGGETEWRRHGLPDGPVDLHRARECAACRFTGYRGRVGLHELMMMNGEMRGIVYRKSVVAAMREAAVRGGMIPLLQDGLQKVLHGLTTVSEVQGVCSSRND